MNLKEVVTGTRPDVDALWGWDVLDKKARDADFRTRYVETGKILKDVRTDSADKLVTIFTRLWLTSEDYDDYLANPYTVDLLKRYHDYHAEKNIVVTTTTEIL